MYGRPTALSEQNKKVFIYRLQTRWETYEQTLVLNIDSVFSFPDRR